MTSQNNIQGFQTENLAPDKELIQEQDFYIYNWKKKYKI